MPLGRKQFTRRAPQDQEAAKPTRTLQRGTYRVTDSSVASTAPKARDGVTAKTLVVSDVTHEGQLTSDLRTQDLLREVLYELKHIRLHMEALSGEDLRGDVKYADQ